MDSNPSYRRTSEGIGSVCPTNHHRTHPASVKDALARGANVNDRNFLRTNPANTYFDARFPNGESQYISFEATCWAVMALVEATPAAQTASY